MIAQKPFRSAVDEEDTEGVGSTAREWVLRVLGRDPGVAERGPDDWDPDQYSDLADLDAELERIRAADDRSLIILGHRLEVACRRGVRLVELRRAPVPHAARLVLADGLVAVVRAERPGALIDIAVRLAKGERVSFVDCAPIPTAVRLTLRTMAGLVEIEAIGFDQAD